MSMNDDASEEHPEEILIRVLGLEDKDALNSLAKLIGQDTGRQLLDILINSEKGMYKGELTKKMPVTYSVTSYHLSNAEKLGLVEKSERIIHKKGIKHTHNKIPKQILMIPLGFDKEELKKIKTWKKLIRNGIKFAAIGIVTALVFSITDLHRIYNPTGTSYSFDFPAYVGPLSVLVIGLIAERIIKIKKGKN